MSIFIMAFSALIQQEIELAQRVSEEEWDEIRPSKIDRRQSMVSFIKVRYIKNNKYFKKKINNIRHTNIIYYNICT